MVIETAFTHLIRRSLDSVGACCVQHAETTVGARRGDLLQTEGVNEAGRKTLLADIEYGEGALGLRPPIAIGGNLDRTESVLFSA